MTWAALVASSLNDLVQRTINQGRKLMTGTMTHILTLSFPRYFSMI